MHATRLARIVSGGGVKHPPIIPDQHVRRTPLVLIRRCVRDHLPAASFQQRIAFWIFTAFDTDRHPR
jgi:hypothetical protein